MVQLETFDRIVFFDTETVGLNPNYIISLAYRYYQRGQKPIIGQIRCNPDYFISEEASKVNGFTNEMVKNWPTFDVEWEKIREYFEGSLHIGHNVSFDERALRTEFKRYGITSTDHYELDTWKISRRMIPKAQVKNYKLISLCEYFGIEGSEDEFHAADFDIWATDKLFRKLREKNAQSDGLYGSVFIPTKVVWKDEDENESESETDGGTGSETENNESETKVDLNSDEFLW